MYVGRNKKAFGRWQVEWQGKRFVAGIKGCLFFCGGVNLFGDMSGDGRWIGRDKTRMFATQRMASHREEMPSEAYQER